MKLEINDSYIAWVNWEGAQRGTPPLTEKELEDYVNEVLANHKASWQELDEPSDWRHRN